MLSKEELQVLFEREGINEFFPVIDAFYLEECQATIYELETDYYGVMFRIFPPAYCGPKTEEIISSALTCGLPADTVVQFTQFSSRNLEDHIQNYEQTLSDDLDDLKIDNPQILRELHNANVSFLEKHTDKTVFEKSRLAFYLRDFVNLVTVMFPMRDKNETHVQVEDIVPLINKLKGSMFKFSPVDFDEHRYIRLMRELVSPYRPIFDARRDPSIDIRDHIADADAIIADDKNGTIRLQSSKSFKFDTQERVPEAKRAGFLRRLMRRVKAGSTGETEESVRSSEEEREDTFFAKVMSRKMFPEYFDLHTMSDLVMDYFGTNVQQQMPLPYMINFTVKLEDTEEATAAVKESAQWNMWQLENAGKLASYFPELKDRAQEAKDIVDLIDRHGEIPMKGMWSMVVYSKSQSELDYYTSIIKSEFQRKAFILQEEDLIGIPVFLYSMPMNYHEIFRKWSKRFTTIFKSNVASVVPLGTDSRGFGLEPIVQLYGRNGQPQNFDLYDPQATNKNAVLIGPSGKGKSFAMARIVWSYLKGNSKIRIIDSGHSYRELCLQLGGQYVTFPEGNTHVLNPFTNALLDSTGELYEDDVANIIMLVGVMAGLDLDAENANNLESEYITVVASYVGDAIRQAFGMAGREAGMYEIGLALRNELKAQKDRADIEGSSRNSDVDERLGSLIAALREFTEKSGQYYRYVNGPSNIDLKKDLVVLDMDDLSTKERRFRDFVLTAITNTIQREFYIERANRQRKLLIIDESWSLLSGKAGGMIQGLYRRSRKLMGSIITISQSINDYNKNEHIKSIFENAYWRLFLEQDSSTIKTARDSGQLIIDEYAFKLLETVQTKVGEFAEMMVLTQPGGLMIGRVLATKVEYWVNTQSEHDLTAVDQVVESFGVTESQARMALGFSEMNGTLVEDEVLRLAGYTEAAAEELLQDEVA